MRRLLGCPSQPQFQIVHLPAFGQSLAVGAASAGELTNDLYKLGAAFRFIGGPRPQNGGGTDADFASLAAYNENNGTETHGYGQLQMIRELLQAENGLILGNPTNLLFSTAGESGKNLAELQPGTAYFDRLKSHIDWGRTRTVTDKGGLYSFPGMGFIHGQADVQLGTSGPTFQAGTRNIRDAIAAYAGTNPAMAITQVSIHPFYAAGTTIALAQLDMCDGVTYLFACPMYFLPYGSNIHLTSIGYKWLGAYIGKVLKRLIWDGVVPPYLKPGTATRSGTRLTIPFTVPALPLVFDTSTVPAQTNKGFELLASDNTPLTITAVTISGSNVLIDSNVTIPAGARAPYARQGDALNGLGNLRDSEGDTIVFDVAGINKRMDNWCPIFEAIAA